MRRASFVLAAASLLPTAAFAKEHRMVHSPSLAEVLARRAETTEVRIFHVDQAVRTRIAIRPDQLETVRFAQSFSSHDRKLVESAYDALAAAEPEPSGESAEFRWKLVFLAGEHRVAEVYASTLTPFGRIGETDVRFRNDRLREWLEKHFVAKRKAEG